MPTTEEQRRVLCAFKTRNEALREARKFSQMSGLATHIENDTDGCLVIVENQGPIPSQDWRNHVAAEDENDEITDATLQERARDFLLGRVHEGDHLPSKQFHRVFTENLKHPEHFLERFRSSQYLLMVETFNIGNRKCRKLLDLGRLAAFSLHHMSGASPPTAFLSALYALNISRVELSWSEINPGLVKNPRTDQPLFELDAELIQHAMAISDSEISEIDAYETYRGAFYELRRRDWNGFVFFDGSNWVIARPSVRNTRNNSEFVESSTDPTQMVAVDEYTDFSAAQQRARILAAAHDEPVSVRRTEAGWIVLVSAKVAAAIEETNVADATTDWEEPGYEPPEHDDEYEREMEDLQAELDDDRDSYSRSDEDGWFYPE